MNPISKRIKLVRNTLGLTQSQFGQRIGVKGGAVSAMQINENDPSERTIISVAREFHVNMEWLKTGDGQMFTADQPDSIQAVIPQFVSLLNANADLKRMFMICMNRFSQQDWANLTAILQAFASGAKK